MIIDVDKLFTIERATDLLGMGFLSFTMPSGHYANGRFPVIASFQSVTQYPGSNFLHGTAVDEFGWEHTGLVLAVEQVAGIEFEAVRSPAVKKAPFRVGVQFDNVNRLRLTVPDDVAVRLYDWSQSVWREHGWNSGSTTPTVPGTWEHEALAYLHAIQCRLGGERPFIEGESYSKGNKAPVVSTYGVEAQRPTGPFQITG